MKPFKPFLFITILILILITGCTNTTRILHKSLIKGAGKNIWKSSNARYFRDSIAHRFGLDTLERFVLIESEDNDYYCVKVWTYADTLLYWVDGWKKDSKFEVYPLNETDSFIIKYIQMKRHDIIKKVSELSGLNTMSGALYVTDFDLKRRSKAITISGGDFEMGFDFELDYGSYPREIKQYIQDMEDNKNPEPPVFRFPKFPEPMFPKPQKTPEEIEEMVYEKKGLPNVAAPFFHNLSSNSRISLSERKTLSPLLQTAMR